MMLIPQPLGLGPSETHKPPYFVDPSGSPPSIVASVSTGQGAGNGAQTVFSYSTGEGCLIPGRMQSELPGLNMYAPQPGSSALASPTNYGSVPGAVAATPTLMTPHYGGSGIEHSPYYSTLGPNYEMKPGAGEMWTGGYPQPPPGYYPYDNTFGPQYPYDRYSMEMNDGVRRKNATRESTNTLKAWLQEHKKNPYPTKGEKIMLAIITKMTLTQVSTWFANARRRLKKENKMTWVPKNRSNENSSGSNDKKEDGDDEDSQNLDTDARSDNEQGADSDDSAEREVTSTNNNEMGSNFSQDNSVFEDERVDSFTSDPNSAPSEKSHHPFPPPSDSEYKPAVNMTCESGQTRFGHPDAGSRAIWSPVNEQARPGYTMHPQERLDVGRDVEQPGYNANAQFSDNFPAPSLGRHAPIVSPGLVREGEQIGARPAPEYHYPVSHQPWSEHGYPNVMAPSSESCSIGHSASGAESSEGRGEVHEIVTGSPASAEYQRQYACGAEAYQRGAEHYLPNAMYPVPRGREIPGNSPNPSSGVRPIDSTSPYQAPSYGRNNANTDYYQQGERLPPPPHLVAAGPYFHRDVTDRLQATNNYTQHADVTGVPLEAATSPSSATVSPPNSRALFHPHRPGQSGPGAPYYGQATNASPASMYASPYYPQDGVNTELRPHIAINPHHPTSLGDVTAKHNIMTSLSPSVNQNVYTGSPGSKSPSVEIGTSPNGRCEAQDSMQKHGTR